MFKKLLILAGMLVVVGWAFGSNAGRDIMSYAKTGWKEVRNATKKIVPIEFEIKRAEDLLLNLDRTDDRLITALAGQMQSVRCAERDVETMTLAVASKRDELRARSDELKTMQVSSKSANQHDMVALQLEKDFKTFKIAEATLKNKEGMFDQLQTRVKSLQEQREGLKGQRAELASRVTKLKTDLDYLKVAQLKAKYAGEDFQVAEVSQLRELVESLEGRIETSLIEHQLREDIKTSEKPALKTTTSPSNIAVEIETYFNAGKVADKK